MVRVVIEKVCILGIHSIKEVLPSGVKVCSTAAVATCQSVFTWHLPQLHDSDCHSVLRLSSVMHDSVEVCHRGLYSDIYSQVTVLESCLGAGYVVQ